MMAKKLSIVGWVGSFFVALALVNWGLFYWLDFNIFEFFSWGMRWFELTLVSLITVIGLLGLGELIFRLFK